MGGLDDLQRWSNRPRLWIPIGPQSSSAQGQVQERVKSDTCEKETAAETVYGTMCPNSSLQLHR